MNTVKRVLFTALALGAFSGLAFSAQYGGYTDVADGGNANPANHDYGTGGGNGTGSDYGSGASPGGATEDCDNCSGASPGGDTGSGYDTGGGGSGAGGYTGSDHGMKNYSSMGKPHKGWKGTHKGY